MRYLVAALLLPAKLLDALPTGRYLGSDPNSPAHSHASDDVFVDEYLQKLWDAAPSSAFPSPPQSPAPDRVTVGHNASSPPEPAPKRLKKHHAAHSPPVLHHTSSPTVSEVHGSSMRTGSSWSLSDLHLLSPIRWDSSPSSSQHPSPSSSQHHPPQMVATNHAHMDHSAPSILECASKRLKQHHIVNSPPPHHYASRPIVSEAQNSSTDSGSTQSPSGHVLGSQEQETSSIHGIVPLTMNQTRKLKSLELPKLGLTVTAKAHPQEVEEALYATNVLLKPKTKVQRVHQGSILKTAVASISDVCTSKSQYIKCMKEKYGENFLNSHAYALGRFIEEDLKGKEAYGAETSVHSGDEHTQIADGNDKRFAEDMRAQYNHLWLRLPPADRKEPPFKDEDVSEYHERIKHLDPHRLSPGEYIKQAYLHFEGAPDRWNSRVPKLAMDRNLRSKDASEEMVTHFQKVRGTMMSKVSIILERVSDCTADGTDKGKQARARQRYHKSSEDREGRILAGRIRGAKNRAAKNRAAKALAAPSSRPGPR